LDERVYLLTPPVITRSYRARIAHRKDSPSVVAWCRPHRKHVSRIRLRVDLSVSSTGRGAGDTENTASFIVACWSVFTVLLPGNASMNT
jgi:hypothetical protein